MALTFAFLSITLMAISQLVFKAASNRNANAPTSPASPDKKSAASLLAIISQPKVIAALGLNGFAAICWLLALSQLDLSYAAPLLCLNYLLVPFGAFLLFKEKISRQRVLAILVICSGVLVCLLSSTNGQA